MEVLNVPAEHSERYRAKSLVGEIVETRWPHGSKRLSCFSRSTWKRFGKSFSPTSAVQSLVQNLPLPWEELPQVGTVPRLPPHKGRRKLENFGLILLRCVRGAAGTSLPKAQPAVRHCRQSNPLSERGGKSRKDYKRHAPALTRPGKATPAF